MSHNRQSKKQVFTHYRFSYVVDLDPEAELDISTLGDLAITA